MEQIGHLPVGEFGTPGPLRDRLVAAILSGDKTGTSSLHRDYFAPGEEEPLPQVGNREIVVDSNEEPVAIIEIAEVHILPLGDITGRHAFAEGEGFATVADWKAAHLEFWNSPEYRTMLGSHWQPITDASLIVYTFFKLIKQLP